MQKKSYPGFTLIETLVSVAIFTLAVSLGTLVIISMNQAAGRVRVRDQAIQSIYYVMDTVSRSVRTGTQYESVSPETFSYIDQKGDAIELSKSTSAEQLVMYMTPLGSTVKKAEPLHDVYAVKLIAIQFKLKGAAKAPIDSEQPSVAITAQFGYEYRGKQFIIPIQTTLTQRYIDIGSALGGLPTGG